MAKVLRLDRIASYVSPAIENKMIQRGDTVRVDDKTAAYLLEAFEIGDGGTQFPHFIEVDDRDGDMDVTVDAIVLKDERLQTEREAKGIQSALAAPPLRHQRAHVEDADQQEPIDYEEEAPAPRRTTQRAAPAAPAVKRIIPAVKKVASRRLPARV